jgi:FtsZ-binding cell division protein ZapB
MYKQKVIDIASNKETLLDYSLEEMSEVEKAQQEAQARVAAEAQAEAKRQTALSKLAALGLEVDDLKALGF